MTEAIYYVKNGEINIEVTIAIHCKKNGQIYKYILKLAFIVRRMVTLKLYIA